MVLYYSLDRHSKLESLLLGHQPAPWSSPQTLPYVCPPFLSIFYLQWHSFPLPFSIKSAYLCHHRPPPFYSSIASSHRIFKCIGFHIVPHKWHQDVDTEERPQQLKFFFLENDSTNPSSNVNLTATFRTSQPQNMVKTCQWGFMRRSFDG